ncbi:AAA family ATPase [Pedococcus sp. 5OH_020]|uniref:AAA family ATPase n=1 Tax=Pedococcus sp. 5OH_020 TaxID=2989814 RepID=UPI0022E9E036|nr:AAA family ATPase [Pedococcus sp. 5OH_020]
MTLLWDNDPTSGDRYAFALGGDISPVENLAAAARSLQESADPLMVIGPDIDMQSACDLSELARVERPELGVILLRRRVDVAVLGQALRAGIREVLTADDLTGLAEGVRRSLELSAKVAGHVTEGGTAEGRIVTVFSAKGGVGKTTFSTNLGAYLASQGSKVLLMDLDLAFGDVAISLQLLPQNSMSDLIAMGGHVDAQGLSSIVTKHESGLDVAAAPSEPSDADRIPGALVGEALRVARRHYDYVVVDTPPAFTEHVLAAFDVSDLLILIATLDIPAVKNLRLSLDTLDLLGNPRESRVVVLNRSDAKVGLRSEDVVAAIRQDIAVMVPSSPAVPASINRGVPIVLDEPKHPVSGALRELADRFVKVQANSGAPRGTEQAQPAKRERWSLARGGKR